MYGVLEPIVKQTFAELKRELVAMQAEINELKADIVDLRKAQK